jgi:hypothetical protein
VRNAEKFHEELNALIQSSNSDNRINIVMIIWTQSGWEDKKRNAYIILVGKRRYSGYKEHNTYMGD